MNQSELYIKYPDSESCTCEKCQKMCRNPCIGTPEETRILIEHGYANRLMVDNRFAQDFLCPAWIGLEGKSFHDFGTPSNLFGCTFFHDGLCEIQQFKLLEARFAHHDRSPGHLNKDVVESWDSELGRTLIHLWEETMKSNQDVEEN